MDPHDQQGKMEGEELERREGVRMGKRVTHRQAGDRVSVCGQGESESLLCSMHTTFYI